MKGIDLGKKKKFKTISCLCTFKERESKIRLSTYTFQSMNSSESNKKPRPLKETRVDPVYLNRVFIEKSSSGPTSLEKII